MTASGAIDGEEIETIDRRNRGASAVPRVEFVREWPHGRTLEQEARYGTGRDVKTWKKPWQGMTDSDCGGQYH